MKTFLTTTTLAGLLALTLLAPAQAAPFRLFGDCDGALGGAADAIQDLKLPDTDPAVGMLLPAIQKVREAANRSSSACPSDPSIDGDVTVDGGVEMDGSVDMECMARQLSEMILDSQTGRDGSPGLLNLMSEGSGMSIKQAKLYGRKAGSAGAPGTEQMIIAVLIGLLREADIAKCDGSVREPLMSAIKIADGIDPDFQSAKPSRAGYDMATNKKM